MLLVTSYRTVEFALRGGTRGRSGWWGGEGGGGGGNRASAAVRSRTQKEFQVEQTDKND